jgi:hypothetical protein
VLNEGGAKECQQKWAEIAPLLQCKLCNATVDNSRVSPNNNRRRQNKNKWYTQEHHENLDPKAERKEHKKAIYICTMCMSDNWEIIEPSKWLRSAIKTVTLSTQTGRVWQQKIDGNIKGKCTTKPSISASRQRKTASRPPEELQSATGNDPWTSWRPLDASALKS